MEHKGKNKPEIELFGRDLEPEVELEVERGGEHDVPLEQLDRLGELVLQLRVPDILARLHQGWSGAIVQSCLNLGISTKIPQKVELELP